MWVETFGSTRGLPEVVQVDKYRPWSQRCV